MTDDNVTHINIDELSNGEDTYGVQYAYRMPVTGRVIPLPVGISFEQATAGLANYNRTMGRKTKTTKATLVERVVTAWSAAVPTTEPRSRKPEPEVVSIVTAFGV